MHLATAAIASPDAPVRVPPREQDAYTRAPEPAQAAPQAPIANGLTPEELDDLRANSGPMKQMAMAS